MDIMKIIMANEWLGESDFFKCRQYLREKRLFKLDEGLIRDKDYVVTCASIEKFYPDYNIDQITQTFNQLYYYKSLTWIQERYFESIVNVKEQGYLNFKETPKESRIYCTFHMGSYRMIIPALLKSNIDLAVVLAKDTLDEQHASIIRIHEKLKEEYHLTNTLDFIDAESSMGAIKMIRALNSGKSLLFYIDGNTGVNGKNITDEKLLPINFFQYIINVRKGIAYIAHKCNVPIILGLSHYLSDDIINIRYYNPIEVNEQDHDVKVFSERTIQTIYDQFSELLVKYPSQWEGWLYLHSILDEKNFCISEQEQDLNKDQEYVYDKKRFSYFIFRERHCILDKQTFQVYPVDKELIYILETNSKFKYKDEVIPQGVFEFLYSKGFFIL